MGILFGGFDEFQTPRLPPPAIPLPYLVLTVLSLIALLPPLVLAASSRDSGHPALVNLLVSFFIYLLASGLVVFSQGGRIEEFPSLSLCLVQGSMMVAGTPSLTMTAATYIFFLYATLQTSKKWLTSFVLSKRGTLALVILPWVVYVLVFVLALIIGHRHPDKVFLRDLYCVVFVDGLAVIRFIGSLIFLIIALASAVSVSVVVFQKHALERRRRAASSATGFGTDPLRLDLWILLEAWSIGAFFLTVALLLARTLKVHTSIPADVMASTGGMLLLLLGNQWGLYSSSSWRTAFNSILTSISFHREDFTERRTGRKLLIPETASGRTSELGPAVSTSTLGLERDEGLVTSSILLSRHFDEEDGMSSLVMGDRSAGELGKGGIGESIQMEGLEPEVDGRKKKIKIKVERVAASELGAEPLPSGRRVYQ